MSDRTHFPLEGDPAHTRYALLTGVLGEPAEAYSRAVLARLVSWTSDDDVAQLAYLIRRGIGRACQRYRGLVREVADHLGRIHDHERPEDWVYSTLPVGLVDRIRATVHQLDPDEER